MSLRQPQARVGLVTVAVSVLLGLRHIMKAQPSSRTATRLITLGNRSRRDADRTIVFTGDTGPSDAVADLAKGADVLVAEVSSLEEWKEVRVNDFSWARWTTPEQQANYVRHMTDDHLAADDVGQDCHTRLREERGPRPFACKCGSAR